MKKLLVGLTLLASMSSFGAVINTPFSGDYTGVDENGDTCTVSLVSYGSSFVDGELKTDMTVMFENREPMRIATWGLGESKTKFNLKTRTLMSGEELGYMFESHVPRLSNTIVRGSLELSPEADSLKNVKLKITNIGITGFLEKFAKTEEKTCSQF